MFEHSWKEEVGHAQKLIEYGLLRGVNINTPSINVFSHVRFRQMLEFFWLYCVFIFSIETTKRYVVANNDRV
jgi:ferritin